MGDELNDERHRALRPLTERLSRALSSEEGASLIALLQRIGVKAAGGPPHTHEVDSLRVGIWDPVPREGGAVELVRSEARKDEWRFWADVHTIPPKSGPRVVLLGESVARAYLYDPAVTVASVLEANIRDIPGLERASVVDLAQSDLTPDRLVPMFDMLPALEPDAIVLFAGNNWHNFTLDLDDLEALANAIREDGYAGCRRVFVQQLLAPRARRILDRLASSAGEFRIPVVVIVPEFDLMDWGPEPTSLAPLLHGGGNVEWLLARDRAGRAMLEGDLAAATSAAAQMIAIDRGTCGVGHWILGRAAAARGETAEARARLEAARDAVCGTLVPHSPRCPSEVQAVLRQAAAEHGFALVDLPRIFERHSAGGLPGRDLFLDYCHLTLEGIRLATAAVARELAPLLGAPPPTLDPTLAVDPDVESAAHFLAALHNAHYGQSEETIRHHCAAAAATEAGRARMLRYVELQLRVAEPWMCSAFEDLTEDDQVSRYLTVSGARGPERLADHALIEAMVGALDRAGEEASRRVIAIVREETSSRAPQDLLLPGRSAPTFRHRDGHSMGPARGFYRAFDRRSTFWATQAEPGSLRLRLTCRLPSADGDRHVVTVHVGGEMVGRYDAGRSWETFEVLVRRARPKAGAIRIDLEWPILAPRWTEELERATRRLGRAIFPDVLPAYGEIHAFIASPDAT